MTKRFLPAFCAMMAVAGTSFGEAQRTLLTLENKFPELHQFEAGLDVGNRAFKMDNYRVTTVAPYVRYGLVKNLTGYLDVPVADSSRNFGNSGAGLGDVKAGLQLRAYEDIFSYPWVVPHIEASFNTGDGSKATGYGKNVYTFGISAGSKMYDQLSLIVDASYMLNGGFDSGSLTPADTVAFAASAVWDISEQLAVLAEGKITQHNSTPNDHQPKYGHGGIVYRFTENFQLGAYVGGWVQADAQTDLTIKGSYTF